MVVVVGVWQPYFQRRFQLQVQLNHQMGQLLLQLWPHQASRLYLFPRLRLYRANSVSSGVGARGSRGGWASWREVGHDCLQPWSQLTARSSCSRVCLVHGLAVPLETQPVDVEEQRRTDVAGLEAGYGLPGRLDGVVVACHFKRNIPSLCVPGIVCVGRGFVLLEGGCFQRANDAEQGLSSGGIHGIDAWWLAE